MGRIKKRKENQIRQQKDGKMEGKCMRNKEGSPTTPSRVNK
jgi:hypothetical protein